MKGLCPNSLLPGNPVLALSIPTAPAHSIVMDNGDPAATLKLLAYCRAEGWAGYDPYDALNSRVLEALPFLNARLPRIALTQLLKRSPVNVRPLALIPKTQNPKALALFLRALLKLADNGPDDREALIGFLLERLQALRSPDV